MENEEMEETESCTLFRRNFRSTDRLLLLLMKKGGEGNETGNDTEHEERNICSPPLYYKVFFPLMRMNKFCFCFIGRRTLVVSGGIF